MPASKPTADSGSGAATFDPSKLFEFAFDQAKQGPPLARIGGGVLLFLGALQAFGVTAPRVMLAATLGLLGLVLLTARPNYLIASKGIVLGTKDRIHALLTTTEGGSILGLYDSNERVRAGLITHGGASALMLWDESGKNLVTISGFDRHVAGLGTPAMPLISLTTNEPRGDKVHISDGGLTIYADDGYASLGSNSLSVSPSIGSGTGVSLRATEGSAYINVASLSAESESTARLESRNGDQAELRLEHELTTRARMFMSTSSESTLTLLDQKGKVIWSAAAD